MNEHPEGPIFVECEDDCEVNDEGPDVEHAVVMSQAAPSALDL